jgi:hypothetical protein
MSNQLFATHGETGCRRSHTGDKRGVIPRSIVRQGRGIQFVPYRQEVVAPESADWGITDGRGTVHHQLVKNSD